jgi:ABC-2 type transport system ATP-binding protein
MTVASRGVAVRATELVKQYGTTRALDAVSFDVHDGELFGLVGPDGAGKTTLFRLLVSLLEPDSGSATVLGLDPVRDLWALRKRVGYMPGRFSLYADLSVRENLEFFAAVFGTSVQEGYDTIAPIYRQIETFADRRAGALSGGMKQKLALSCALVHRPDILFLDEPTTGVDAVSRREFWDLLGTLRDSGLTTIVSTPYMDEAMRCDRVALLQAGRILAIDTPPAIGARFPRALFAVSVRERRSVLAALRHCSTIASAYPFGETVHVSDARENAPEAVVMHELETHLRQAGFSDIVVRRIDAGIEDVFIELMGEPPTGVAA